MVLGIRFQFQHCLLILVGVCLLVLPLGLGLIRSSDRIEAVSFDAEEFSVALDSLDGTLGDDSLDSVRAQLAAFAAVADAGKRSRGFASISYISCFLGGVFVCFGLFRFWKVSLCVRKDFERLLDAVKDEKGSSSVSHPFLKFAAFEELYNAFQSRFSSFCERVERLENERTAAVVELEKEHFSLLKKRPEKFNQTGDAADLSVRKGDFLATMSHEIRTPMNGVLAIADDLLSYDLDREIEDKIAMIKLSGESLVRILDDVLDFSKIEAGKLDVKLQSFDFIFACNATHSLFKALAREKGLRYEVFIDPSVPQFVLGDSVRVRQVVANLLSNAVKFTDEGGVSLTITRQTRDSEGLLLSVSDTGIGIDPVEFDRLFEAFGQAETGLEEKGTGLGLAISKRLASIMDGELSYSQNQPMGSVFDFWIPYFEGTPVVEKDQVSCSDGVVENARILIVEDNRINQHVIESLLERANHEVHISSNGLEALVKIEEFEFDLVFMDCLMPKLDGFETAKRIRALPPEHRNQGVPIVALTANAFAHDREQCFAAGMNDFLAKPVQKNILLGAVNRHCKTRTTEV